MKLQNCTLFRLGVVVCLLLAKFGVAPPAMAQQAAGSITGLVTDASGSAITNATITARDIDRGTTWVTTTTDAGLYEFPTIPVGKIQLKVEAAGFATELRSPFTLILNQVAKVDFHLSLGNVNTTVTVTDVPPLLQTGSTEIGTLIDSNAASSLPLASRDTNQLTLLAPGVISPNIFAFQSSQNTFGTGRPYVNGAREQDNNFTLDGMDINQADNNDVAYVPSPDALQEFNIITSNAPADFGNYIGGVIVETLKSGSNSFHGGLYEYLRNTDLDANTWQDKANAFVSGFGPQKTLPRPVLQWNNFGGMVGGPIIKNKLFFFADDSSAIYNTPKTGQTNTVLPSSAFASGDFSALCTGQGAAFVNGVCTNPVYQLYMPAAGTAPGSRQPIANNKVPLNSKVASAIVGSPLFAAQEEQLNYFTSGYVHSFQGDLKIDWQASDKDHVSGRYSQMYTINTTSNGTDKLTPNLTREYPLKNFVANYDRTITTSLMNELRLGAQIFPANDQVYTNAAGGNLPAQFGLPGVQGDILPAMSFGYQKIGDANGVEIFHDTTYQIEDALTWTHGKHSIHAGFEFYHYIMNDVYAGNQGASGSFTFTGQYTANPTVGANGNGFADFLLGLPEEVQQGKPLNFHLRNSLFGGFVQDNYRMSPTLTLNLGVRYELITARGDKNASQNVNFDKLTGAPQVGTNYNTYTGIDNIQPRIGFSWQPSWDSKSVLRGAYDISTYMEGNGVNNMAVVNPPNVIMHDELNNAASAGYNYPVSTLDQGYSTFSAACTASQLQAYAANCISGVTTHATDPNLQPAVDQQWNLVVQHQFASNTTVSLGYVGNKIDHLSDIYLFNQKQLNSNGVAVPGPFETQLIANGVGQARFNASDGISRYNAMEATIQQRSYHGLDTQFSYTWSKCMTNTLGYFGSYGDEEGAGESQTQATQNFFQNEYNPRGDYGRCTTDVASYFTGYALYNLPFGKGRTFANGVSKPVNEVIGGWQVGGDLTLHSGFGITPFAGNFMSDLSPLSASALTGSYEPRPNCVAGVATNQAMQTVQIGSSIGKTNLNPAAVTEVNARQFGNCQTGALRGPSLKTADFNLAKQFPVTEDVNLTLAAQFINLTNTPIFSVPASWWGQYSSCVACNGVRTTGALGGGSGTVGLFGLLDGSNPGRQVELSLKLSF
ncbi:MAG TPA: carboxypeptidase regulatory-like domain-containing protein [Terracidiphilus sp.]|nr:carboxypeptidase regulatory-like domain-containing protein [Terracidiphilus sp.]